MSKLIASTSLRFDAWAVLSLTACAHSFDWRGLLTLTAVVCRMPLRL